MVTLAKMDIGSGGLKGQAMTMKGKNGLRNPLVADALAMLRAEGLKPWVELNKRYKIKWRNGRGHEQTLVVPVSTSNWNAAKNSRAILRRMLRGE